MNTGGISAPFIRRPVAPTLLTIGVLLAGAFAFTLLPVAPLPQVDVPAISVSASLPGASPETMATSVATPLERQLGRIAGVTEMTSSSSRGRSGRRLDGSGRCGQFSTPRWASAARSRLTACPVRTSNATAPVASQRRGDTCSPRMKRLAITTPQYDSAMNG